MNNNEISNINIKNYYGGIIYLLSFFKGIIYI